MPERSRSKAASWLSDSRPPFISPSASEAHALRSVYVFLLNTIEATSASAFRRVRVEVMSRPWPSADTEAVMSPTPSEGIIDATGKRSSERATS